MPSPQAGRVLVVDDDVSMAESLKVVLDRRGLSVEVATSSAEALAVARRFDPHVVLLDLHLADGADGHELGLALRRASPRPLQIIIVTGDLAIPVQDRTERLGFAAHLVKPPAARDVLRLIDLLLPRAREAPEP